MRRMVELFMWQMVCYRNNEGEGGPDLVLGSRWVAGSSLATLLGI